MLAYSGPLPSAEQIEHYERTYNGAAKLLFEKFAEEQTHRHELEKADSKTNTAAVDKYYGIRDKEVKSDFIGNILGQILSTGICIAGLGACVYLSMNGHEWAAIAVVAIPFAGIIRAMRSGKDNKKTPQPPFSSES
jgi:uncharacterized membrane protein